MDQPPPAINYRSPTRAVAERYRPRIWLSHMLTAAILCIAALYVHMRLQSNRHYSPRLMLIEMGLVIYGATCAIVSIALAGWRGLLTPSDKVAIVICALLFILTLFVAVFWVRLN